MNKKITAVLAAMLMLTACTGGNNSENTDTADVSESVSETVSKAETSAEKETEAQSNVKTVIKDENYTEAASDTAKLSVYEGSFYTISVDESKWIDAKEYTQAVAEAAEGIDNGLDFSADEYVEMCDALFVYNAHVDSDFATNFNIVTQDIGTDVDMDADTLGPLMADGYDGVEGYECTGWESVDVNGNNSLKITISTEQAGMKMDMLQYIFLKGGKQTVVNITAKTGVIDSVLPDFEDVVNTIVLK